MFKKSVQFFFAVYLLLGMLTPVYAGSPTSINSYNRYEKAVTKVLKAFKQKRLVALDEGHHNSRVFHEFLQALIRHPDFSKAVNDIVVEFGSAKYQKVMDDFVQGKDVPDSLLKLCWRETTQVLVWDSPVYEAFFRLVRETNQALPKQRKLRVLLGDPPINWHEVKTINDWVQQSPRDYHAFQLIEKEVVQKKRKALLIYGGMHLLRKDPRLNYTAKPVSKASLVELLDQKYPTQLFVVWTRINTNDTSVLAAFQASKTSSPDLISTNQSSICSMDFNLFCDIPFQRIHLVDGKPYPLPKEVYKNYLVSCLFEGLLWLGTLENLLEVVPITKEAFVEDAYYTEVVRRSKLLNHPALGALQELKKQ